MKNEKNNKKYILIPRDLQKNLIEFLDEVQMEAAKKNTHEDMHIVNFCSWAIEELLNGFEAHFKTKGKKKPQPKSRDQYLDETFMDWNLPEMSDEEYEKLVNQVDGFLRAWEKEYNKDNPNKPIQDRPYKPHVDDGFLRAWEKEYMKDNPNKKNKKEETFNPRLDDVVEHCSLDEIKDMLLDDPELTDHERFDLYYDERERRQPQEKGYTFKELFKGTGITPPKKK